MSPPLPPLQAASLVVRVVTEETVLSATDQAAAVLATDPLTPPPVKETSILVVSAELPAALPV